jgi:glycosyltransferase involved in cell wall biosynthesis
MTRKVLIITYHFPPRPGVASLRLRGLAKYLPEFDWEATILTAQLPGDPDSQFRVIETHYPGDAVAIWKQRIGLHPDRGFQEQVGVSRSLRQRKNSPSRKVVKAITGLFAYPDNQKYWYAYAVESGIALLKKESFDALLSSAGPVTCHLIARELKEKFSIPWIADFRDLWTQNHYYPYGLPRRWFEKKLEIKTLQSADMLITVSQPLAQTLGQLHRGKPVFSIPNGYDPVEVKPSIPTKTFTITYTGKLYQGKRDPLPLFQALSELFAENLMDRQMVKVQFYGDDSYWIQEEFSHFHLQDVVELHSFVPRSISLEKQRTSQILLLLNWDDPGETGVYTGKIFEYLAARRPILAIGGPRGVVSELLKETGAGMHTKNITELKAFLTKAYEEYRATGSVNYTGKEEQIAKYSQVEMARRFAMALNTASN